MYQNCNKMSVRFPRIFQCGIFYVLLLSFTVVCSCGSAARWAEVSDVSVDYDGYRRITYANSEMSFSFPYSSDLMDKYAPVLTFGYDEEAIRLYNGFAGRLGKAVFELSDLRRWNRIADYVVRTYAPEGAGIMFTMPGEMVACVVDGFTEEELRSFSRMYYIAGKDLSYSFVSRTDPSKLSEGDIIYRNLAYDKSLKMYVVSDFLPYGDGKVLCLIYPFDTSTAYYEAQNEAQRVYVFNDSWGYGDRLRFKKNELGTWWLQKDNWVLTMQSVHNDFDRISSSVLETLKINEIR